MIKDTGGPAFPTDSYDIDRQTTVREEGMTLRDYFAAKAMQMLRNDFSAEWVAKRSYEIADAMLKERTHD